MLHPATLCSSTVSRRWPAKLELGLYLSKESCRATPIPCHHWISSSRTFRALPLLQLGWNVWLAGNLCSALLGKNPPHWSECRPRKHPRRRGRSHLAFHTSGASARTTGVYWGQRGRRATPLGLKACGVEDCWPQLEGSSKARKRRVISPRVGVLIRRRATTHLAVRAHHRRRGRRLSLWAASNASQIASRASGVSGGSGNPLCSASVRSN